MFLFWGDPECVLRVGVAQPHTVRPYEAPMKLLQMNLGGILPGKKNLQWLEPRGNHGSRLANTKFLQRNRPL